MAGRGLLLLLPMVGVMMVEVAHGDDNVLSLNNTGPAVLDTPIFFFANLQDFEPGEKLKWMWSDSFGNQYTHSGGGPTATWNMTYTAFEHSHLTQNVTVKLDVLKYYLSVWIDRAYTETSFLLSGFLFGELTYRQTNVTIPKPGLIATIDQTNLTVALTDPSGWLKQHTESASFSWVINDVEDIQCHSPSLIVNFTDAGDHNIEVKVILNLSDEIITTTTPAPTTTSNTTARPTPKPKKWQCDGYWPQFDYTSDVVNRYFKLGDFYTTIKAVEPIGQVNVTGNTWLKHGELVELTVRCSGSPTISYCKRNYWGVYNVAGHEKCGEDEIIMTPTCNISIVSHFPENATRTIVLIMFNDISKVVYPITINIYNEDRKTQLLYIIIPVVIIIIIIVFGILYFIRCRKVTPGKEDSSLSCCTNAWQVQICCIRSPIKIKDASPHH